MNPYFKFLRNVVLHFRLLCIIAFAFIGCNKETDFDYPKYPPCEFCSSLKSISMAELQGKIEANLDGYYTQGVVVSTDIQGNFFQELFVQDPNSNLVIRIIIDDNNIYQTFQLNQRIYIQLNGLVLQKNSNMNTLGIRNDAGEISKIPAILLPSIFYIDFENNYYIEPKEVDDGNVNQLSNGQLVYIEKVEFPDYLAGEPFDSLSTYQNIVALQSCVGNVYNMYHSNFTNYSLANVPNKMGRIIGLLQKQKESWFIKTRTEKDFELFEERCSYDNENFEEVQEIRSYQTNTAIRKSIVIRGVVISDQKGGNVPYYRWYFQDKTAGIAVELNPRSKHNFQSGDSIRIQLKDTDTLFESQGLLFLKVKESQIALIQKNLKISATPTSFAELLAGKHQGKWVTVSNVRPKEKDKNWGGEQRWTDCSSELNIYTYSYANFASEIIPYKQGNISGIASYFNVPQLLPQRPSDWEYQNDIVDNCD